jgi:magnesium chelatase family protein
MPDLTLEEVLETTKILSSSGSAPGILAPAEDTGKPGQTVDTAPLKCIKISGPLLDRIDIHREVPAARYQELSGNLPAETSAQIKERINQCRSIQKERFKNEEFLHNSQMSHKQMRKFCILGTEETSLLKIALSKMNLSARAYDKILKVSRTIADLAGSADIKAEHLSEAIQYRSLDRNFF